MKTKVLSIKNQIVLLACFFALSSCDKVSTTIDVGDMSIQLEDITVGDDGGVKSFAIVRLADDALTPFNASQTLTMDMLAGLSSEAKEYKSKISKVEIGPESSITITTTDENGTVVEDFEIKAAGVKTLSVREYHFGEPYTGNIEEFATQLLMKLFASSNGVPITISGKTDVESGKNLKVKIVLSEVSLVAKVLK